MSCIGISKYEPSDVDYSQGIWPDATIMMIHFNPQPGFFVNRFPNLKSVHIRSAGINDISFLLELPQCETVEFTDFKIYIDNNHIEHPAESNQIVDFSLLSQLTSLKKIYASCHRLDETNFTQVVSGLTQLEVLSVLNTGIDNIEFVAGLTNLQCLNVGRNNIRRIDAVRNLVNLTELFLQKNLIVDIEPIRQCRKLRTLWCDDNRIFNFDVVRTLPCRNDLCASGNPIYGSQHLFDMIGSPGKIEGFDNTIPRTIVKNKDQYVTEINLCYEYGDDIFEFVIIPMNREEQKELANSLNSIFEIMKTTSSIDITYGQYRMTFDIIPTQEYQTLLTPRTSLTPRILDQCNITIENFSSNSKIRLKRSDRMDLLINIYNNMKKINLQKILHTIVAVRHHTQSSFRLIPNELLFIIISQLIPYCFKEVPPFSNIFLL